MGVYHGNQHKVNCLIKMAALTLDLEKKEQYLDEAYQLLIPESNTQPQTTANYEECYANKEEKSIIDEFMNSYSEEYICVYDIWFDCLGKRAKPSMRDSRRIGNILRSDYTHLYEDTGKLIRKGKYGPQRVFKKVKGE